MFEIDKYTTKTGRCPVDEYIAELSKDKNKLRIQASIYMYIKRLADYGLAVNTAYPYTMKALHTGSKEKIYELRPSSSRVLFFALEGNRFVLLHAFTKSSQKTPQKEIENALKEMKEYKRRNGHG